MLLTIFYFILLIGVLIFIHELGHFLVAKACRIKVLTFSLGFGPKVFGFRRGETDYVVAWVPLGGFVKMLGQDPQEAVPPQDNGRAFHQKSLWQRFLVIAAGPVANLLLPVLIYFAFFAAQSERDPAMIGKTFAGQPAAAAGLRAGDRIVAVNGQTVRYWEELQRTISRRPGRELTLVVEREGQRFEQILTPREQVMRNRLGLIERIGMIGITPFFDLAQIGVAAPDSPAAQAGLATGDVVTEVNGQTIGSWADLERVLHEARELPLVLTYLRPGLDLQSETDLATLPAQQTIVQPLGSGEAGAAEATGIMSAEMFVRVVQPDTPVAKLGIAPGDRIVALDGQPIAHWDVLLLSLQHAADKTRAHTLSWVPHGGTLTTEPFRLQRRTFIDEYKQEQEEYVFGAENRFLRRRAEQVPVENRLPSAVVASVRQTGEIIGVISLAIVQLFRGAIPRDSIGGPIILAHTARVAADKGWDHFLWIMALISINLAIFNLLPIPVLDGGHLFFLFAEAIWRRPIDVRVREVATFVGLFFLLSLMVYAFKNDIVRLWLN